MRSYVRSRARVCRRVTPVRSIDGHQRAGTSPSDGPCGQAIGEAHKINWSITPQSQRKIRLKKDQLIESTCVVRLLLPARFIASSVWIWLNRRVIQSDWSNWTRHLTAACRCCLDRWRRHYGKATRSSLHAFIPSNFCLPIGLVIFLFWSNWHMFEIFFLCAMRIAFLWYPKILRRFTSIYKMYYCDFFSFGVIFQFYKSSLFP